GSESTISVKKKGYQLATKKVSPSEGQDPVRVSVALVRESMTISVSSDPAGADIWIDGKKLAQSTPTKLMISPAAKSDELRKKCFSSETVPLDGSVDLGKPISRNLSKIPSCR